MFWDLINVAPLQLRFSRCLSALLSRSVLFSGEGCGAAHWNIEAFMLTFRTHCEWHSSLCITMSCFWMYHHFWFFCWLMTLRLHLKKFKACSDQIISLFSIPLFFILLCCWAVANCQAQLSIQLLGQIKSLYFFFRISVMAHCKLPRGGNACQVSLRCLMKSNIPLGFVKHSLGHVMLLLRSVRFFAVW